MVVNQTTKTEKKINCRNDDTKPMSFYLGYDKHNIGRAGRLTYM